MRGMLYIIWYCICCTVMSDVWCIMKEHRLVHNMKQHWVYDKKRHMRHIEEVSFVQNVEQYVVLDMELCLVHDK